MAGKVGGARPGAGRKKGGKNSGLPATAKLAAAMGAAIVTSKNQKSPQTARPGIDPKDLLLESMRSAWDALHEKLSELRELDKQINELAKAGSSPELSAAQDQRKAIAVCAGVLQVRAESLAQGVAPYVHPKLANTDSKIAGALTVTIKQYPIKQQPAAKVAVAVQR